MKRYCFDTSGLSNPLETLPEDIHGNVWGQVRDFMRSGQIGVTIEIYNELALLPGELGLCIRESKSNLVMEVLDESWDWQYYVNISTSMLTNHREFISEYNGYRKSTICTNDISIIALAKALGVPVVSMEVPVTVQPKISTKKRHIPDVCFLESVDHLTFNQFLRRENIKG